MGTIKKEIIYSMIFIISLNLSLCFLFTKGYSAEASTVLTETNFGKEGDFSYSLWKDYGNTSMTLKGDGLFECSWDNIGNALFRKGINFDSTKTYQEIGDIYVDYGVDYQPDGNSYLCIYGWSRDPLIEYYIVESWGSWRPPGAESKGKINVDGGSYDVYETTRINQPSIDGTATFKQYWSVRTSKRTSGNISVTEHFKAWEKLGMSLGKLYETALTVEGYQSRGKADVYKNIISFGEVNRLKKPAKPVIAISASKAGITVSIGKTENASGYRVYVKKPGSKKYTKLKTIKKNGKKERKYIYKPEISGTYFFKVKAYNKNKEKTVWGSAVKTKVQFSD